MGRERRWPRWIKKGLHIGIKRLCLPMPWWRHQMETFSALLSLCEGNPPVTGGFPSQRPVRRSFDVFFDRRLHKRLSIQSRRWWFEIPSQSLWRHRNAVGSLQQITTEKQKYTLPRKIFLAEKIVFVGKLSPLWKEIFICLVEKKVLCGGIIFFAEDYCCGEKVSSMMITISFRTFLFGV